MMRKGFVFFSLAISMFDVYGADVSDLDTALQNTYHACVNIDENLHDLKVLAGINTTVTAIGTGLGIGANAVGVAKSKIDKEIEGAFVEMRDMLNEYQGPDPTEQQRQNWLQAVYNKIDAINWNDDSFSEKKKADLKKIHDIKSRIEEQEEQSKKLGNWRTGLLGGNTVTNVAGAIISSQTINKDDIQGQVNACIAATRDLGRAMMVAKLNGQDTSEAVQIYNACSEYEYVDISPIIKRGKGVVISSSIGAATGAAGTITSALANSKGVRDNNTDAGRNKEKNLNTSSNVLAGGAAIASATATVFNATQVSAIKKVTAISQKCTEVLK